MSPENPESLKVILVAGDYPPLISGVGDYTDCLSKALAKRRVKVAVVTTKISGAPDREISSGVEIRRIVHGWAMSDVRRILTLIDEMGARTIIHVQYNCPITYGRKPMVNLLPAILRVIRPFHPVVATIHGFHEQHLLWRFRVLPMVMAAGALILVNSKDHSMVTRWFRPSWLRTDWIPIGSNISFAPIDGETRKGLRRQLGFRDKDIIIAFFGGMRPEKGFMHLFDAVRDLRSGDVGIGLLVIGGFEVVTEARSPYAMHIREALREAEEEGWARLARAPEAERVSQLLQIGDLAVFPFQMGAAENRGSLLAAIAHGLPTITSRGPSTPPGFEEDFGVETVPVNDQKALVTRIHSLASSEEAREKLRQRALLSGAKLSWDAIALRTVELYGAIGKRKELRFRDPAGIFRER